MRRPALALTALIISAPAYAATTDELCSVVGKGAALTMEACLRGAPIDRVLAALEKTDAAPALRASMRTMILAAYETPAYTTEEVKARVIREFGTEWQVECLSHDAEGFY